MNAAIRQALVQAAHLLADAMEGSGASAPAKEKPLPRAKRRQCRPAWAPPAELEISEVDMERARQAAKRAGIPIR